MRITPRDSEFFALFTEAGRNVADAADVLARLTDPAADRAAVAATMRELEHTGDSITHNVYRQLNQSFVTPFDREDIYRLAAALDDVVDEMEEATDFVVIADVGPLPDLMVRQIQLLQLAAHETADAMPRLRSMQELQPYWIEVNRLENEADTAQRKLLSLLFSGQYKTMLVLKLREVANLLEEAADALERVANAVENIVLKES